MIHLLEVTPELTPAQAKKLSRRYAMTGGVEICLKPGLATPELKQIIETFSVELAAFQGTALEQENSIASTILKLAGNALVI